MPASQPSSSSFSSVSALSKDDVWFVGPGSFAHYDGKSLNMLPGPDVKAAKVFVNDLAFRSDDDGWAVGSFIQGGESNGKSYLLSLHWDGNAWTVIPTPGLPGNIADLHPQSPNKDAELEAVTVISKNDVWAVGSYSKEGTIVTLTLHWDGVEWRIVPSPNVGDTYNYLLSVASLSKNDVWAFGLRKVGGEDWENQPLSMHWDGTSWHVMDSPATLSEIGSASVSPSKDIWVVSLILNVMNVPPGGTSLLGSAVRERGGGWKEVHVPEIYEPVLRSVVAFSSDDVWAVGYTGSYRTLVIHWDGKAWSEIASPNPSQILSVEEDLQGFVDIAGVKNDVWAVGWFAPDFGISERSMLAHFVGCSSSTQ